MSHWYYITPEEYDIAEKNGLTRHLVSRRVRGYGWPVQKAITIPSMFPHSRKKRESDLDKKRIENGIPYTTFRSRIAIGWDPELAATLKRTRKEWARSRNDDIYKRHDERRMA